MAYKLTPEDCKRVLRGDTVSVHETELMVLYVRLSLENDVPTMYRLQGQIAQLIEDMTLPDKANKQIQKV